MPGARRPYEFILNNAAENFSALILTGLEFYRWNAGDPIMIRGGSVAKVLCVLYDDPVDGYPKSYARDHIPVIASYYSSDTS